MLRASNQANGDATLDLENNQDQSTNQTRTPSHDQLNQEFVKSFINMFRYSKNRNAKNNGKASIAACKITSATRPRLKTKTKLGNTLESTRTVEINHAQNHQDLLIAHLYISTNIAIDDQHATAKPKPIFFRMRCTFKLTMDLNMPYNWQTHALRINCAHSVDKYWRTNFAQLLSMEMHSVPLCASTFTLPSDALCWNRRPQNGNKTNNATRDLKVLNEHNPTICCSH